VAAQPPAAHAGGHAVALGGLQFGNGDDSGAGLEVGGGGGGKVAVPESRLRTKQPKAAGLGEEAPCLEEIAKPVPIFKADLPYTDEARKSGIEGALTIKVTVGADGAVSKVDVLKSVDPALDAAAVAAAMKWRFKPGMRCGKAVAGAFYVYKQVFELGD
jgi:TonB family protein